jgi:hypothetical protein
MKPHPHKVGRRKVAVVIPVAVMLLTLEVTAEARMNVPGPRGRQLELARYRRDDVCQLRTLIHCGS